MFRIEQERIEREWTLDYVAQMLGTAASTVCDYEKGRSKPSYEKLAKLENLFNLSHRELFTKICDNTSP